MKRPYLPKEPSLNEQPDGDVEIQPAEPTLEQAEPMEVEEEPQKVQQNIHAEVEVNPPKVTSLYRRLRSSSRLSQSE